jgi:hypothetical protein
MMAEVRAVVEEVTGVATGEMGVVMEKVTGAATAEIEGAMDAAMDAVMDAVMEETGGEMGGREAVPREGEVQGVVLREVGAPGAVLLPLEIREVETDEARHTGNEAGTWLRPSPRHGLHHGADSDRGGTLGILAVRLGGELDGAGAIPGRFARRERYCRGAAS